MKLLWSIGSYFALCALGCLLQTLPTIMQATPDSAKSQQQPPAQEAQHDGQHDFDFNLGTWHTHIKRLEHPLTGSTSWVEMQGTVVVRKVWERPRPTRRNRSRRRLQPLRRPHSVSLQSPSPSVEPDFLEEQ